MSEDYVDSIQDHGPHQHAHVAPTTQQMRTVGQRRRDAEEKLEHHLQEARHKDDPHPDEDSESGAGSVGSEDVAASQHDDSLSAADRDHLIANPVVTEGGATPDDK